MKRREFITLLGGAAVAWPFTARGRQGERIRRVGALVGFHANDPQGEARVAAFRQGLQALGWIDGRNLRIDLSWGAGDADSVRKRAAEMMALAPEVVLAAGSSAMAALQQQTRALPIVFVQVVDPVGGGFVESLAAPGGNVTGFTQFEYGISGKWLELLKELAPSVTRVAILVLSSRWRLPSAWSCARSTCATSPTSSAASRRSPAPRTAA